MAKLILRVRRARIRAKTVAPFVLGLAAIVLMFRFILTHNVDPAEERQGYLQTGSEMFEKAQYREAADIYRQAVHAYPRFAEAWFGLGLSQLNFGQPFDARVDFKKTLELEPKHVKAAVKLAELDLYLYFSDPEQFPTYYGEADQLIKSLAVTDPHSFDSLRLSATMFAAKKDYKTAVETYRRANLINPDDAELSLSMVRVLFADGEAPEAFQLANRVIEKHSTYAPMYDILYSVYLKSGQMDKAEQMLKRKVATNPHHCEYQIQLAEFYRSTHREKEADLLVSTIDSDSQDLNAPLCVGDYYFRRRRFREAVHEYFKVDLEYMSRLGHGFFLRSKLAEVLIAQHLFREAADIVSALRAEDLQDPDIVTLYAELLLSDDDIAPQRLDALIADLTSALKRSPGKYEIEFELGRAYAKKHDTASIELAHKYLEKSLMLRPDSIAARSAFAQLLVSTRDYGRALALSEEVLKVDPENPDVRAVRSESLRKLAPVVKPKVVKPKKHARH